jgi:hypothetical protein
MRLAVATAREASLSLAALKASRHAGFAAMISPRSDETFIADLAVGPRCGQLKFAGPARGGERVANETRCCSQHREPQLPFRLRTRRVAGTSRTSTSR